jgi:hypothetical protein
MACDTAGCDGRLRTVEWWDRLGRVAAYNPVTGMAGLRSDPKGSKEPSATEHARLVRLDVDMLALLHDYEADRTKRPS